MYGPTDPLPPLPDSDGWDPTTPDENLLKKPSERKPTREDHFQLTSLLDSAGIHCCCLVGVAALQHFGAKRVSDQVDICVPRDQLDDARRALLNTPEVYEVMRPRNQYDPTKRRHTFPWFRRLGVHVFYVLIPDSELHFRCNPNNIELDESKAPPLPYPTAAMWAEALIELSKTGQRGWGVDLDDMVDGLAASEEWGREHLREECWERWERSVRGTKKRMMGGKYPEEEYLTRFRRREGPVRGGDGMVR